MIHSCTLCSFKNRIHILCLCLYKSFCTCLDFEGLKHCKQGTHGVEETGNTSKVMWLSCDIYRRSMRLIIPTAWLNNNRHCMRHVQFSSGSLRLWVFHLVMFCSVISYKLVSCVCLWGYFGIQCILCHFVNETAWWNVYLCVPFCEFHNLYELLKSKKYFILLTFTDDFFFCCVLFKA